MDAVLNDLFEGSGRPSVQNVESEAGVQEMAETFENSVRDLIPFPFRMMFKSCNIKQGYANSSPVHIRARAQQKCDCFGVETTARTFQWAQSLAPALDVRASAYEISHHLSRISVRIKKSFLTRRYRGKNQVKISILVIIVNALWACLDKLSHSAKISAANGEFDLARQNHRMRLTGSPRSLLAVICVRCFGRVIRANWAPRGCQAKEGKRGDASRSPQPLKPTTPRKQRVS